LVNRERDHFAAVGTYRSIERSRSIEPRCRPMKRRSLFKLSGYCSIGLRKYKNVVTAQFHIALTSLDWHAEEAIARFDDKFS
jgi:hypothetical protein